MNNCETKFEKIKNEPKCILNVISTILASFDPHSETIPVEIDEIPEILRLLKYSGPLSKNPFSQPIVGRHIWVQCLQQICWLVELCNYNIDI